MELYMMQHGSACTEAKDPQRPLSTGGIEQVKTAGRGIKHLGLSFDLIITSPKRRAQQTAALIAEAVRYPYSDILSSDILLPQQEPQLLLDQIAKEDPQGRILVVGHLPHLANLAAQLLDGAHLAFENAGLSCLVQTPAEPTTLRFHLTGQQLALLAR
jgi:phosphohistidine phosphatase